MSELRIQSKTVNDHASFTQLGGTMDADSFAILEDEFNRLLESGVRGAAFDLSELEVLTSAGLGAFVNLTAVLRDRGGECVLAALPESIDALIDILGMREVLRIVATRDEANAELAKVK